ncbi:MAG: DNA alkylation repair protein [Bacteroidetes bacterium]|nr:DNA alkylation repair protein [Bacteroidota bacterium]MBU1578441.1 DNA alkylation repair protein [Bacteroidota bacterium]MBU2464903.1 DNA alkylation repair protein [Bacteroidota bacterium]MBU2557509.1 DNA alkylation repair protein [Bacteroidota bacterium]
MTKPHIYWKPLIALYEAQANPEIASGAEKYMRNQYPFYGIPAPVRAEIFKTFIKSQGLPDWEKLEEISLNAWQLPQREMQYAAMNVLDRSINKMPPEAVNLLEKLIVQKSWWDTIDFIAPGLAGPLFRQFPEIRDETISRWMDSGNFWLQRSCLLFQLKYKQATDEKLLFELCEKLSDEKEFFIRKAIGWALRQYARTAPEQVRYYVEKTDLQPLSRKEALKHL